MRDASYSKTSSPTMTVFAPCATMDMHTLLVSSRKATGVQSGDAQLKTAVVRGVGGKQASQLGHIWFTWVLDVAGPPWRRIVVSSGHHFGNTSFAVIAARSFRWASSRLVHPHAPRDRSCFLIGYREARQLEGQLDLTMMVALVPDHVLQQQDRVVIVKVHLPACLHPALHCVSDHLGAVVQHLRDAVRVPLNRPLFLGCLSLRNLSGELGGVLRHKDESHIMDVCEHLRDRRAVLHRPRLQPTLRDGAKQVDQNGVVPVPRIQQSCEERLV